MADEAGDYMDDKVLIKALRDDTRMTILMYLMQYQTLSFQDIVDISGKRKSTISHHLKLLKESGLVAETETEDKGHKSMKFYTMNDARMDQIDLSRINANYSTEKEDLTLRIFDFGLFYLRFLRNLLDTTISYNTLPKRELDSYISGKPENDEEKARRNETLNNLMEVMDLTKFMARPLDKDQYKHYIEGIVNYTMDFMSKLGKKEFKGKEDQYWVIATGIPLDLIREVTSNISNRERK